MKLAGVSEDRDELLGFVTAKVPITYEGRSRALLFLGAFAKLREGSSGLSVWPFAWNSSSPTTDFYETQYLSLFFRKSVGEKFEFN